jgi:amidohydrolase
MTSRATVAADATPSAPSASAGPRENPRAPTRQATPPSALGPEIDARVAEIEPRLVGWRRDLHEHPELGNREVRTARVVADHLRELGLQVRTGVAHTGVVGVLRGDLPGPTVAIRADMDALPVHEDTGLPFASRVQTTYDGRSTFVMHACGHDMHTAIAMGVADVLASQRARLPGTVVFLFQPAEEGAPDGERGGAELMVEEGALADPKPDAIFGLHVIPQPVGDVLFREGPTMAAADELRIVVHGEQTHAAYPWRGVDPITVASQIVLGLQLITARQLDKTQAPTVISIGSVHGGVRNNIIPDQVELLGTIRTFDAEMREDVHARVRRTAEQIAASAGATVEVTFGDGTPVVDNDPNLTAWLLPTLRRVAGADRVKRRAPTMGAEDFAVYQREVPGVFFFLGIVPPGTDPSVAAPNHSPHFVADEAALALGVRTLAHAAVEFLASQPTATP